MLHRKLETSILHVDSKFISKTLALRIKNVLPSLISSNQTAYMKNRLIANIMDVWSN